MDDLVRDYLYRASERLKKLKSDEIPTKLSVGLCSVIKLHDYSLVIYELSPDQMKELDSIIYNIFKSWPEFSGSYDFPVPYRSGDCSNPILGFSSNSRHCKLYDRNTKYGRARWRLCDHMIEEITKLLES